MTHSLTPFCPCRSCLRAAMPDKHTYLAWAVAFKGRPEFNIRLAFSPEECWELARGKFNAKTNRQLKRRGIGIVRVRVTVEPVKP